jgi:hypothetical protein
METFHIHPHSDDLYDTYYLQLACIDRHNEITKIIKKYLNGHEIDTYRQDLYRKIVIIIRKIKNYNFSRINFYNLSKDKCDKHYAFLRELFSDQTDILTHATKLTPFLDYIDKTKLMNM